MKQLILILIIFAICIFCYLIGRKSGRNEANENWQRRLDEIVSVDEDANNCKEITGSHYRIYYTTGNFYGNSTIDQTSITRWNTIRTDTTDYK